MSLSPVAKTALDSIQSKQSALFAGYDMVVEHHRVYQDMLDCVAETLWKQMYATTNESETSEITSSSTTARTIERKKSNVKRQTPLINAGYAARVLAISYQLSSFIKYHSCVQETNDGETERPQFNAQIVVIGCGLDVISFWAAHVTNCNSSPCKLRVVEIDTPDVCALKRDVLDSASAAYRFETDGDKDDVSSTKHRKSQSTFCGTFLREELREKQSTTGKHLYYGGMMCCCDDDCDKSPSSTSSFDYLLIPLDLTNSLDTIEMILKDNTGNDNRVPTFVLSELVLSYVPPEETDKILHWCAQHLCQLSGSILLALEPLGFGPSDKSTYLSVAEGYRRDYCEKFDNKMNRGTSKSNRNTNQKDQNSQDNFQKKDGSFFYPIGCSKHDILKVLSKAGFGVHTSSVCDLGSASSVAAASLSNPCRRGWKCPEIFDEHAALILHLKSYVIVCGIVPTIIDSKNDLTIFRRYMCPWEWPHAHNFARASLPSVWKVESKRLRTFITEIEIRDEQSVRLIFEETYITYWDEYPSIRKMVKGVLNKEMDGKGRSTDSRHLSSIADFYRAHGGIFLVALGGKENQSDSSSFHEVLGFVGVRRCESKDLDAERTLEIFRLAVDAKHRGCGVGRKLLEAVEMFARATKKPKLIAHTLAVLKDASRLYSSCGYNLVDEFGLGDKLTMIRYEKQLD